MELFLKIFCVYCFIGFLNIFGVVLYRASMQIYDDRDNDIPYSVSIALFWPLYMVKNIIKFPYKKSFKQLIDTTIKNLLN